MTEIETVQAFFRALERSDVDAAIAMCSDDIVYQNVPFPADRGKAAVLRTLAGFGKVVDRFEVHVHNIASNGHVVLTERTDVLAKGRYEIAPWVCGTFEVHDGKITLWRDYFDLATITASTLTAVPRAIVRSLSGRA